MQIASANNAMQSMLKANQQVYDSFQTQITKIISTNTEVVAASLQDYVKTFQADSDAMLAAFQKQMAESAKG